MVATETSSRKSWARRTVVSFAPAVALSAVLQSPATARQADCCAPRWEPGSHGRLEPVVLSDLELVDIAGDGAPVLFAAGRFSDGGSLAYRQNDEWVAVPGSPLVATVLEVFDDGSGRALYVGGRFQSAGGVEAQNIARWDSNRWSPLGEGVQIGPVINGVRALEVFDDGSGPALYVGGQINSAGGFVVNNIAKWDGARWSDVGSGVTGPDGATVWIGRLLAFERDGKPALCAGGNFWSAGGSDAIDLATWDGTAWSPIPLTGFAGLSVSSMAIVPIDGVRDVLAVTTDSNVSSPAATVGVWDGEAFQVLGLFPGWMPRRVVAFDDGSGHGQQLHATGVSTGTSRMFRWSGTAWEATPNSLDGVSQGATYEPQILALLAGPPIEPGSRPVVYAAGTFLNVNGVHSPAFAQYLGQPTKPIPGDATADCCVDANDLIAVLLAWGACGEPCPTDFDGDGDTDVDDLITVILNWAS